MGFAYACVLGEDARFSLAVGQKAAITSPSAIPSQESPISVSFRLTRAERLRGQRHFQLLRKWGQSYEQGCLRLHALHFAISAPSYKVQVAFAAPKKLLRRSTARNRTKRILREAFRQQKGYFLLPEGQGSAWLLWTWRCPTPPTLQEAMELMKQLFSQFCRRCAIS